MAVIQIEENKANQLVKKVVKSMNLLSLEIISSARQECSKSWYAALCMALYLF